ncbi:unnamed protein product [Caenorhabditis sp. 36 PRJEB53466]|nr:unnamed protein product [Caenorhabditis sp. 36 PRJEB53466]
MISLLLIGLLLFVRVVARAPLSPECLEEIEQFRKCAEPHKFPNSLLREMTEKSDYPPLRSKHVEEIKCFKEPVCKKVKDALAFRETKLKMEDIMHIEMFDCLNNGVWMRIKNRCQSGLTCEDPSYAECLQKQLEKEPSCRLSDIELLKFKLAPLFPVYCHLKDSLRGRKNG